MTIIMTMTTTTYYEIWYLPGTKFSTAVPILEHYLYTTTAVEVLNFFRIDYCRVERNGTGDVTTPLARRDHRKSKIGLRHDIKLN